MNLTKKHFDALAKVLRDSRPNPHPDLDDEQFERLFPGDLGAWETWVDVVQRMTHYLKSTNPLFDHEKFWQGCGLPGNQEEV